MLVFAIKILLFRLFKERSVATHWLLQFSLVVRLFLRTRMVLGLLRCLYTPPFVTVPFQPSFGRRIIHSLGRLYKRQITTSKTLNGVQEYFGLLYAYAGWNSHDTKRVSKLFVVLINYENKIVNVPRYHDDSVTFFLRTNWTYLYKISHELDWIIDIEKTEFKFSITNYNWLIERWTKFWNKDIKTKQRKNEKQTSDYFNITIVDNLTKIE